MENQAKQVEEAALVLKVEQLKQLKQERLMNKKEASERSVMFREDVHSKHVNLQQTLDELQRSIHLMKQQKVEYEATLKV